MSFYGFGSLVPVCSLLCILDLGEDGHLDNDLWRFAKITDRVMYSYYEI